MIIYQTGYIAPYSSDMRQAAMNLSVGILWACSKVVDEVEMEPDAQGDAI